MRVIKSLILTFCFFVSAQSQSIEQLHQMYIKAKLGPRSINTTVVSILDSYSESLQNDYEILSVGNTQGQCQSFTSPGATITSCKFFLQRGGSPTGNITANIYAHSGTFGTSSLPTGSPLATSTAIDVSTIGDGIFYLITFTFPTPLVTTAGYYCVTVEFPDGDSENYIWVGNVNNGHSHAGNLSYMASGNWYVNPASDICFYCYGIVP
jgi:hypothetical protein